MQTNNIPTWVRDAIFYQIFPDRFARGSNSPEMKHLAPWGSAPTFHNFQGGDLYGVIEKLDYLQELGITAIYLNPIFSSACNHRYHTYDYFTVDPLLGGNEALRQLIDEVHKRGMRIILDGVFNHASRGFFQFNHLMECGEESPYVDWFHIHEYPINAFDTSKPASYSAWWGLHALPKFNTDNPDVREYLLSVGEYWLEQGIDGWRLDVPNEINDDEFWREFRTRCHAVNDDCYIVGEIWHDAEHWLQGDQFDAIMNYVFGRAGFGFIIGDNMDQTDTNRSGYGHIASLNGHQFLEELDRILNRTYIPDVTFAQMNLYGSHDVPRTHTIANNDRQGARMMYLLMMAVPGTPNIYYGDEICLGGAHDPDNRRAFPWDQPETWDTAFLEDLKTYIQFRTESDALRRGSFISIHATYECAVFARVHEGEVVLVALNSSEAEQTIVRDDWQDVLPAEMAYAIGTPNKDFSQENPLVLPARSLTMWQSKKKNN